VIPPVLEPWAAELALFRPEIVGEVGPWLPRLSAAMGPLRSRPSSSPFGEPNGFDGLTRRGTYDRLLLTEWALAEELPDEFIRRAAMREHLFLQPARIEPRGSKRTVALFDAGPDQIGPMRLVHLAILMVLKRRADQAGGLLQWGHLQHETLHTDLDPVAGPMLFSERTALTPTAEAIRRWIDVLAETETEDDVWIIGGPDARMRDAHRVEIIDPYDPERREALVALHHRRGQRPLELALALPSDTVSAALIRAPFARRIPTPAAWPDSPGPVRGSVRFNPTGGAVISHSGLNIRSWGTPRPDWLRAREYQGWRLDDEHPIAVGWYRKRLFCLVTKDGTLQHRLLEHRHWKQAMPGIRLHPDFAVPDASRPIGDAFALPPAQKSIPANPRFEETRASMLLQDAVGAVWVACFATGTMTMLMSQSAPIFRSDVTYLGMVDGDGGRTLVILNGPQPGGNVRATGMRDWFIERKALVDNGPVDWVQGFDWGANPVVGIPDGNVWVAARIRRYSWKPDVSHPIPVAADERVFACEYANEPMMYAIAADSMAVRVHRRGRITTLFESEMPILSACVSRSRKVIGYWMANGEMGFYDPYAGQHRSALLVGTP